MFPVLIILILIGLLSLWWGLRSIFTKVGIKAYEQTQFFNDDKGEKKE